jgi:predicted GNAT family N-acyltransferase
MNIPDYRIEPADYRADLADLRAVREAVFIAEQQIPEDLEFDEMDPHCHHVIARDFRHRPIGTGRLTPEGKIGRMAVIREWRNRGVGRSLLQALVEKAIKSGWTEVGVNAQVSVMDFYEKAGFIKKGAVFIEAGIPHQTMQLLLPTLAPSLRSPPKARKPLVNAARLNALEPVAMAAAELIADARRQFCLYTRDLECALYGRPEIIEALKQFAIRNRDGQVQIIVQNTMAARQSSHPLLSLAQRLPSTFLFRTPVEPEDIQYVPAFLVNDCDGYLFRPFGDRYEGHWSPAFPEWKKQLYETFDQMWQRSLPCSEFRTLSL